jgi:hypothetical protein
MRPYADVALRAAPPLLTSFVVWQPRRPPAQPAQPHPRYIDTGLSTTACSGQRVYSFRTAPSCEDDLRQSETARCRCVPSGVAQRLTVPTVSVPVDRGRRPRRSGSRISCAELGRRLAAVEAVAAKRCEPRKRHRQVSTTLRAYVILTTSATRGAAREVRPFGPCSGRPC